MLTKFTQDTPLQKIKASFLDDSIELTENQKELKKKIRQIYTLRLQGYSKAQVKEFAIKEYKISQATSYRLYDKTIYIYGELSESDSRAEKEVLRELYFNIYQEAMKDKDLKLAKDTLDKYRELFDFTIKEDGLEEGQLKAHSYHIKVDKSTKAVMDASLKQGLINFNAYPSAEEVPYEEIKDGA